jgi:mono/diheme cytochrome c family protein
MRVFRVGCGLTGLALVLAVQQSVGVARDQAAPTPSPTTVEGQRAFVQSYCAGCHNDRMKNGGFSWTELDVARPDLNAKRAEDVIRKVRAGLMPPAGARRPEAAALKEFSTALGTRLDETASAAPVYKAPELHRMNRREYRNAIRDLLHVDVDVSALLPPDARTGAFDNMADALTINPGLMQAYVRAADKVARQALGDPATQPAQTKYDVPKRVNQMRHIEGTPLGTRGGIAVTHHFPADGEYVFQNELYFYYLGELIGGNLPDSLQGQELEISIDGARVAAFTIDPLYEGNEGPLTTKPVRVTAGPHRVAAAFVAKADGAVEDSVRLVEQTILDVSVGVHTGMSTLPHLMTMTVVGPTNASGVSDTPSRRHILTCTPANAAEEPACAKSIATTLARRAFRRTPTPDDIDTLMKVYEVGRDGRSFEDGVRTIIQGAITRPEFIFRFERVPEAATAGQHYRLDDFELASRLAYFLWGSTPDDALLDAAAGGQLRAPGGLERQVRRMLADRRAESLSTHFAAQWLRLTGLADVHPEPTIFPDFTRDLATSMRREVELLFDSIVREDRPITDLLTADYTFVNEVLARHYGIPNVAGPTFRRVALTDPNRFGLMGRGAILTQTSLANRTSPVARGKYVLEVLMGAPPPLPLPNVPPLSEQVNNAVVLERLETHRRNPTCSGCHKIMDPIGLALENFDATGKWRTKDGLQAVDPRGEMYDGRALDGPVSLRQALLGHADAFRAGFSENLLAYALGRVTDFTDMPAARAIARQGTRDRDRLSAYVLAVVNSGPFQMRTLAAPTETLAPAQQAKGVH